LPEREPALPPKAPDSGQDPMTAGTPANTPSRAKGTKQLTVWIDADLHKRMNRAKVELEKDLKVQVEEAIRAYLEAKGF
ncbi:hypothetical protein AB0E96_37560, partial [Kitasatospora sp. NPDC036755]|uniref:hypothetical protein n=1 Tax=Kitasatospora sp. NPDC036755 TaxID=3154600 RepID=UPI0033FFB2E2